MTRKMAMTSAAVVVTSGMMIAARCEAGVLKKERVAPESTWVVHVDVEAGLKSELGQWVQAHEQELDLDLDGLDEVKQQFGIDLRKDLKDFTAYGIGNPHEDKDAVIVATTTSVIDDTVTALKGQMLDAFTTVTAGGYSLESVKHDEEELFFFIKPGTKTDERIVVLGHDMERVAKGVALVEGRVAKTEQSAALSRTPRAGSVLFVSASQLPWFDDDDGEDGDAHGKIMKRSKGLAIDCGEHDGQLFMEGLLMTATAEDAQDMKAMADGMMALGRMALREEEEMKPLLDMARSVKVDVQGNGVRVVFEKPTSELTHLMEEAIANEKAQDAKEDAEGDRDDDDSQPAAKKVEEHKEMKGGGHSGGNISIEAKRGDGAGHDRLLERLMMGRLKGLAELTKLSESHTQGNAKGGTSHFALSLGVSMKYETGVPSLEVMLGNLDEQR